MRHSPCAEWVWLLDTDAFIMNLASDHLGEVIRNGTASVSSSSSSSPGGGEGKVAQVDVIAAKDINVSDALS